MFRTKVLTLLAVAVLASLSMGITWGDTPATTTTGATNYLVNYFTNANTAGPDGTVQLVDPNVNGGSVTGIEPDICALIYVFYPDEEMAECCGCILTPDGLDTLSVNHDLTFNPLTGVPLTAGVIKIVPSAPPASGALCNAAAVAPTNTVLAWGTHILAPTTGGYWITETAFSTASISANEVGSLVAGCKAIQLEGSGHGVCTCGTIIPN